LTGNGQQGPASGSGGIDDKVVDATLNAYYPAILASVDSARSRSQVAYTIASATAAALVTAGVLSHIQLYSVLIQVAGGLALTAWLVAAALFMRVSKKVEPPEQRPQRTTGGTEWLDAAPFVIRALETARATANKIDERLGGAILTVYVALALTVLSFVLALALPPKGVIKNVSVDLTPAGSRLYSQICGTMSTSIVTGELEISSLSKTLTAIELQKGSCKIKNANITTLVIPTSDIAAIAESGGKAPFYP